MSCRRRFQVAGGCLILVLAGCAAPMRQRLLSLLIDTPQPPPPTQRLRRDLLQEIATLNQQLADAKQAAAVPQEPDPSAGASKRPIEQTASWKEAASLLPHDAGGYVDWAQAVRDGVIAPRASWDAREPQLAVFPLDVALKTPGQEAFAVGFPHSTHTTWLACGSCHPGIFPLPRGQREPITMAKIRQGQFCGVCHGKVSFSVEGRCARCHTALPPRTPWAPPTAPSKPIEHARGWEETALMLPTKDEAPDWTAALVKGVIAPRPGIEPDAEEQPIFPSDVVRVPPEESGGELLKVTFPHSVHTAWLKCESCHPEPFQMKAGATPISMEKIHEGKYCGVCHGTVAFPRTSCNRCHTAMEE